MGCLKLPEATLPAYVNYLYFKLGSCQMYKLQSCKCAIASCGFWQSETYTLKSHASAVCGCLSACHC